MLGALGSDSETRPRRWCVCEWACPTDPQTLAHPPCDSIFQEQNAEELVLQPLQYMSLLKALYMYSDLAGRSYCDHELTRWGNRGFGVQKQA